MRYLFPAFLTFALAVPCWAEQAKPNTLTPEEIADGWLLLFDGETTFGWDADAKPHVENGNLVLGSDKDVKASTTTAFLHYELRFEYHIEKATKAAAVEVLPKRYKKIPLTAYKGWAEARVTSDAGPSFIHDAHPIEDQKNRNNVRDESATYTTSIPKFQSEPEFLSFAIPKSSKLSLRNIKMKPLKTTTLFNGKDLTGWKEFPDRKSKFTVSNDGVLSIKNGPGDLQTTGQWADFLLQLECKTNGDNLNSGVFFRCQPDKYQQGYEAQIQNQHAKSPKAYTVEEFDPQTHKLKEKHKVENWSQDYGTGAIYRRIPARRAVAKDREWFTMTVVARGRHVATWVNGIQVVDWTDNRPNSDNGRNGYRAEKGPISLQGHDPTTDLSFRNIRIADLSESKKN